MAMSSSDQVYHRLIVDVEPKTMIWLVDDCWHLVQKAVGRLDTSVLAGRYFIELGPAGPGGVAYPIELLREVRLTQEELESGPACQ